MAKLKNQIDKNSGSALDSYLVIRIIENFLELTSFTTARKILNLKSKKQIVEMVEFYDGIKKKSATLNEYGQVNYDYSYASKIIRYFWLRDSITLLKRESNLEIGSEEELREIADNKYLKMLDLLGEVSSKEVILNGSNSIGDTILWAGHSSNLYTREMIYNGFWGESGNLSQDKLRIITNNQAGFVLEIGEHCLPFSITSKDENLKTSTSGYFLKGMFEEDEQNIYESIRIQAFDIICKSLEKIKEEELRQKQITSEIQLKEEKVVTRELSELSKYGYEVVKVGEDLHKSMNTETMKKVAEKLRIKLGENEILVSKNNDIFKEEMKKRRELEKQKKHELEEEFLRKKLSGYNTKIPYLDKKLVVQSLNRLGISYEGKAKQGKEPKIIGPNGEEASLGNSRNEKGMIAYNTLMGSLETLRKKHLKISELEFWAAYYNLERKNKNQTK